MGLNLELLQARFEDIQQSVKRLEVMQQVAVDDFLADQDMLDIASYRLLVAIESALQICFHVSAQKLQAVPENYAQCFSRLEAAGLISSQLSRNLQQMARFRNMLVHRYWDIAD